ncbi:MAG: hypothetical protein COW16_10380 [Sphingomonadales bacterium CG12_big_fil_rev_8_21_14_0_65_65_10]|nr:MAG: hypothetical protein COW16_10380 [Sphingomonadales bacterium CG12_big_fil_rev_8_21_14_0_65_65_10]
MRVLGKHALKHPIVLTTVPAGGGEDQEEELKSAGFEVIVTRPRAKDMRAFDRHQDEPMAAMIDLVGRCTRLTEQEVDHLDASDFEELGNLLNGVIGNGPEIGGSA